jgi:hypothetical protein
MNSIPRHGLRNDPRVAIRQWGEAKLRYARERGAIIVLTAVVLPAILLTAALAIETFRLLTSRLQMENIAEYSAEVALDALNRGDWPPGDSGRGTVAVERILSLLNANRFVGQKGDESVGSNVMCYTQECSAPIKIVVGCYNPATDAYVSSSAACPGGSARAVYVRASTFNQRSFVVTLGKLFNAPVLNFSTQVVSYNYNPPSSPPPAPPIYQLTRPWRATVTQ